jgi:hypothetical protein
MRLARSFVSTHLATKQDGSEPVSTLHYISINLDLACTTALFVCLTLVDYSCGADMFACERNSSSCWREVRCSAVAAGLSPHGKLLLRYGTKKLLTATSSLLAVLWRSSSICNWCGHMVTV